MSDLPPEEMVKALRRGAADADEIAQNIVDSASAVGAAGSYHGCQARADYSGAMRQAAALIERLEARGAELEGALKQAAEKFQLYATLHAEKNTLEGNAKALANRKMAAICEAALAQGDRP